MAFRQNTALRNILANAFADTWDGGTLKIYSGAQPADTTTTPGTLLATITLPTPAFGSAASGVVSKSGTWSALAVATNTAGWARFANSGGTVLCDVSVGESASDLIIDNDAVVSGGEITVTSFTYTVPAS